MTKLTIEVLHTSGSSQSFPWSGLASADRLKDWVMEYEKVEPELKVQAARIKTEDRTLLSYGQWE